MGLLWLKQIILTQGESNLAYTYSIFCLSFLINKRVSILGEQYDEGVLRILLSISIFHKHPNLIHNLIGILINIYTQLEGNS